MTKEESKLAERIAGIDRARSFVDNFDALLDFALFPFLANPTQDEWKRFNESRGNQAFSPQRLATLSGERY